MKTENNNASVNKEKTGKKTVPVKKTQEKDILSEHQDELDYEQPKQKRKSGFSFFKKLVFFTAFSAAIVFVSLNISPILKYALQDQNSAIYPILKKYADELRVISSRLTGVTRRLNMLSVLSKENDLNNISNVNRLVLQINDMWTTTKKYLNLIGIETIAHSNLEKEIDANSKINNNGAVIQDTKVEQVFPEDHFTLTNILNLDSIVQDLNIEIDNIDNEITYLENNVYASIKASNIYSQLLERSRNSTNDYYSNSDAETYPVSTIQAIAIPQKTDIRTSINAEQKNDTIIESTPVKQLTIKKQTQPEIKKPQTVVKQDIPIAPAIEKVQKPKIVLPTQKTPVKKSQEVKVANIQKPIKKPIEPPVNKIISEQSPVLESRKDQSNKLMPKDNTSSTINSATEKSFGTASFDSPGLLDDVTLDFNSKIDDYGEIEIKNTEENKSLLIEEDDDYTGG